MNAEPSSGQSIQYQLEPQLSAVEFIDVLNRSTLGQRRPVADVLRIEQMRRKADVIVTARSAGLLVGVSRALTDFCYCTYLSDLAVDEAFQKQGITRAFIERTHQAPQTQYATHPNRRRQFSQLLSAHLYVGS